jgi:hypothetical protein
MRIRHANLKPGARISNLVLEFKSGAENANQVIEFKSVQIWCKNLKKSKKKLKKSTPPKLSKYGARIANQGHGFQITSSGSNQSTSGATLHKKDHPHPPPASLG